MILILSLISVLSSATTNHATRQPVESGRYWYNQSDWKRKWRDSAIGATQMD